MKGYVAYTREHLRDGTEDYAKIFTTREEAVAWLEKFSNNRNTTFALFALGEQLPLQEKENRMTLAENCNKLNDAWSRAEQLLCPLAITITFVSNTRITLGAVPKDGTMKLCLKIDSEWKRIKDCSLDQRMEAISLVEPLYDALTKAAESTKAKVEAAVGRLSSLLEKL